MSDVMEIKGHVGESKRRASEERRERQAVEQGPNTLLSKRELQGEWDAARVLMTSLDGELRQLTKKDIDVFRKNIEVAQDRFKGAGITARQVLDIAATKPLRYKNPDKESAISDLDKAKREIRTALPASANGNVVRFVTGASPGSKVSRHHVTIKVSAMDEAIRQLALVPQGDKAQIKKIALWLRKQKLSFDCDCERHRYYFRYIASIGGFAAGRQELAYPKINNPRLRGVACKHVIRAMNEFDSSTTVLNFLIRLLTKVHGSNSNKASLQTSKADAKKMANQRARAIKTTDDRAKEAARRRTIRATRNAAKKAKRLPGRSAPPATQRYKEALESGQMTTDDLIALLVKNNINPTGE